MFMFAVTNIFLAKALSNLLYWCYSRFVTRRSCLSCICMPTMKCKITYYCRNYLIYMMKNDFCRLPREWLNESKAKIFLLRQALKIQ